LSATTRLFVIGTQPAKKLKITLSLHNNNKMKKSLLSQGFTLIELAILVALIMVLALSIRPVYSNYIKRDKVAEGLILASTAKEAVIHHAIDKTPITSFWKPPAPTDTVIDVNIYITDTTGVSISSHGQLTKLPALHSGEIVLTFSPDIAPTNHNQLILSPRQADYSQENINGHELPVELAQHSATQPIIWECNSDEPPSINRGTRGTLYSKLAPADCRS
jgi:type IV pilus assembly protein PilA